MKIKAIVSILTICLASTTGHAQLRTGTGKVKELYDTNCAACHSADLSGGMGSSLIDDEWAHGSSDEDIAKVIREGIADTGMIPWGQVLSDEQIRSLVIFIREQKLIAQNEALNARLEPENGIYKSDKHAFQLEEIGVGTAALWGMDFMPDGSALTTQIDGKLWIFKDGNREGPIRGTPDVWNNYQGGLLDVALHPDYAKNGWIYLSYSKSYGENSEGKETAMTAVVRGRIKNGSWVDEETIFSAPAELASDLTKNYHFGSRFAFKDGYVFFGIGERGEQDQAQDLSRPNGKIHRLHDDGRVPKDNPFVNREGAYPSIWSYGNRNPQGLAINPQTGELWEAEHGPRGGDEVNIIEAGKNYGWPLITYGMNYDGTPITNKTQQEGLEQPVTYWVPSIAISTMGFYTGDQFPLWKNQLFVAGLASGELHRLEISGSEANREISHEEIVFNGHGRIRDLANGPDGNIYLIINDGNPRIGKLYRLVPAS